MIALLVEDQLNLFKLNLSLSQVEVKINHYFTAHQSLSAGFEDFEASIVIMNSDEHLI